MAKQVPYSVRFNGHEIPVMHFTEERLFRGLHALGLDFQPNLQSLLEKGGFTLPFGRSSSGALRDNPQILSFRFGTSNEKENVSKIHEIGEYPPDALVYARVKNGGKGIKGYEVKAGEPQTPSKYRALTGLFPAAGLLVAGIDRDQFVDLLNRELLKFEKKRTTRALPQEFVFFKRAYQPGSYDGKAVKFFVDDARQIREQLKIPSEFQLVSLMPLDETLRRDELANGGPGALHDFEREIARKLVAGKLPPERGENWARWYVENVTEKPDKQTLQLIRAYLARPKKARK